MRYAFALLLFAHGLIHLLGFLKAFHFAEINQLNQAISKPIGLFWLAATILFVVGSTLLIFKNPSWWMVLVPAILLSQWLIFSNWQDAKFGSIANLIALIGVLLALGSWIFFGQYQKEAEFGLTQTSTYNADLLTEADLKQLPLPVAQYIRFSGSLGKPKVPNFRVVFSGQIRQDAQSAWMPFESEQYNFMEPATRLFFLHAKMKGLPVAGFHSFKNGSAFMDIRLLSLFKVQYLSNRETGIAETVTFFNDMCCLAPATLIDKRIQWLEVVENKVKASFTNNGTSIHAWLYFDDSGALVNFVSEDRYAASKTQTMQQLPWATPLKAYKELNGHKLFENAETIYTYPEGDFCYGTFKLLDIQYNCTYFKHIQ